MRCNLFLNGDNSSKIFYRAKYLQLAKINEMCSEVEAMQCHALLLKLSTHTIITPVND